MNINRRLSWKHVRDTIHNAILCGRYGPGDRLPRDADFADTLNCARSTVQRAMQDLSDSGLVERRRRGGTRVRLEPVTRAILDIPLTRCEVEQKGARYGHQLIRCSQTFPPRNVMAKFELSRPHNMLQVEALHLSNGLPYILEDRWISLKTVPEAKEVDFTWQSANEWLLLNRPYSRCDVSLFAISANDRFADLLQVKIGVALFVVERTTWIDEAPITTVQAITTPGYQLITSC